MRPAGIAVVIAALSLVGCGESSPATAWPYHEVFKPNGKADGTVLYFHGGNWKVGSELVRATRPLMRKFTQAGWRAVSADYSAEHPLRDTVRWYRRLAKRPGPICVAGDSAGAQLALMVAVKRNPDCVIAEGAPVDLTGRTPLHEAVLEAAETTFGEQVRAASPLYGARRIDAPVILGHYREDRVVPLAHARAMKNALGKGRLKILDGPGSGRFVHAWQGVQPDQLRSYQHLVKRRLRQLG